LDRRGAGPTKHLRLGIAQELPQMFGSNHETSNGTPASAVDLHPTLIDGVADSRAINTDGIQQVGEIRISLGGQTHATVWEGAAESAVDLHPEGFHYSTARGVSGGQQVGWGEQGFDKYALLW
jgi:hypothetical protein